MTNRIREWRDRRGKSLEDLAYAVGISPGFLSRLETGGRNVSLKHLPALARELNVLEVDLVSKAPEAIPVMGRVGAGAEIEPEFEQVPPEGLFEVEVGIPLPPGTIGFEVIGDSMYPRYDEGDVIVCAAEGEPQAVAYGSEAAVRTADGRRFLKRVVRSGDQFTLESHNAPPMRDIHLEWASPVLLTVRRASLRKMENQPVVSGAALVRKARKESRSKV